MGAWLSLTQPIYAKTHLFRLKVDVETPSTTMEGGRLYEGTHVSLDPRHCNTFDHLIGAVKRAFSLDPEIYQDTLWMVYCVLDNWDIGSDGYNVHLQKVLVRRDTPSDAIISYLRQPYTFYFEPDPHGQSSYGQVYE